MGYLTCGRTLILLRAASRWGESIDVSQFSVGYKYVLFGAPDQGQTLDVYRSDF